MSKTVNFDTLMSRLGRNRRRRAASQDVGPVVRELATRLSGVAAASVEAGLEPAVAGQVMVACGVDALRAACGDEHLLDVVTKLVEARLAQPVAGQTPPTEATS